MNVARWIGDEQLRPYLTKKRPCIQGCIQGWITRRKFRVVPGGFLARWAARSPNDVARAYSNSEGSATAFKPTHDALGFTGRSRLAALDARECRRNEAGPPSPGRLIRDAACVASA
jgi:hypothetical protein